MNYYLFIIKYANGAVASLSFAENIFRPLFSFLLINKKVMFSKNAVVTQRDGEFYLLFRIGNMRKSHLIEAHVRAQVIHYKRISEEGEEVRYDTEELAVNTQRDMRRDGKRVEYDSNGSEISDSDSSNDEEANPYTILLWPVTVAHKIDKYSPFYALGPKGSSNNAYVATYKYIVKCFSFIFMCYACMLFNTFHCCCRYTLSSL